MITARWLWMLGASLFLAHRAFGAEPAPARPAAEADAKRWWAFQPLTVVTPPPLAATPGISHPIDRFLLARAAAKALRFETEAHGRTLVRRACLDLHGLPPEPEVVESFLNSRDADAWPRLIDRLLAEPAFGERWARHWLDVARFAESSGFEHDYDREGAFHYRDFVIKAFNSDLPYDQFVRWQVAGDEFEPGHPLALVATGFLGAGVFPTQITANEVERTRYDAMDDMLSTTGTAFLGLTIGCARCHDHKYDPIPSHDYYRLLSAFTTTVRSVIDLDLDPETTRQKQQAYAAQRLRLEQALQRHEQSQHPAFDHWLASAQPPPFAPWRILELDQLESKAGATFHPLDDGSHLVEGKNADRDTYTFSGRLPRQPFTALRLDALAHPSMKHGGPGRADNGNIGLSRVRLFVTPASGGTTQEVKIVRAHADFEQNLQHLSIAAALDDRPDTGWAVDPRFGKDHAAVFVFAQPLDLSAETILTVRLEFQLNTRHNLGRPRLSLTTALNPSLEVEPLPPVVADWLERCRQPGALAALAEPDRRRLFAWWKRSDPAWREHDSRLQAHLKAAPDGRTKVLVCAEGYPPLRMHTQGADFFDQTFFLNRGNTDQKSGVAAPGFLQVLMRSPEAERIWLAPPPQGAKYSGRRQGLARWLTDVDQGAGALLARVMVNRLWQHHFGQGLVATPNDFGHTGSLPTHPELLDWLAGELIRHGWRLKPIHRLLMTSAAYRQAAAADPAKLAADPANELIMRRLPRRLEGEAIRDSILAVSGVLDPALYGPGTRDERSRRRSVYFTVKRSQLVGSMVAFDLPEPLVSQGSRPTTTVAPQALFLMNAPQLREWAEAFARRLQHHASAPHTAVALVASAYRLALARGADPDETRAGVAFLEAQTTRYAAERTTDPSFRALTDLCQVLFGLHEFAYLP